MSTSSDEEKKSVVSGTSSDEEEEITGREEEEENICRSSAVDEQRTQHAPISSLCLWRLFSLWQPQLRCTGFFTTVCFISCGLLIPVGLHYSKKLLPCEYSAIDVAVAYVPCLMMISAGIAVGATGRYRKKNKRRILVPVVLVLSLFCIIFCGLSLVYLLAVVHPKVNRLEECTFDSYKRVCSCVGPDRHKIKFSKNLACGAVIDSLKNLNATMTAVFSVCLLVSVATAISSISLWLKEKRIRQERTTRLLLRAQRRRRSQRRSTSSMECLPPSSGGSVAFVATQTEDSDNWCSATDTCSDDICYDNVLPPSYSDAVKSLNQKDDDSATKPGSYNDVP